MVSQELVDEVVAAARRLIGQRNWRHVSGNDIAIELGREPDTVARDACLYEAFREAKRFGLLECVFPGGWKLPTIVRLPP
jgi:hypothetical protein